MRPERPKKPDTAHLADEKLERQILGAIMRAAKAGNLITHELRPLIQDADRFAFANHQAVYRAIVSIADAGGAPTVDRVIEQLRLSGFLTAVQSAAENPLALRAMEAEVNIRTRDDIATACVNLVDYSLRRQFDDVLVNSRSLLRSGTEETGKVVAQLTTDAWKLLDGHTRFSKGSSAGELVGLYRDHERMLQSETESPFYLQTGLFDVDRALGKRVGPGSFVVGGAHTSVGKTVLAAAILRATGIHGDLRPAHLTLEETRVETQERIIAGETRIPMEALQEPSTRSAEQDMRKELFEDELLERPGAYWVEEMAGASLAEIISKIRVLHATAGARLFIVDYLQIIDVPGKERRERELAECSKRLKGLALELGVIIIALAQLNDEMHARPEYQRFPQLRDLRECKALAHDANVVILIDRPEQHIDPEDTDVIPAFHDGRDARGLARLHIAKIRRGKKRRITVRFLGQYQTFDDVAIDDSGAQQSLEMVGSADDPEVF